MNIFMSLEMVAIGKWNNFDVFVKTPWWVNFALLFLTTTSYIWLAFLFSTISSTKSQAFTVNFCVILASMVQNIVLSEPTIMKKVFFNLDQPDWVNYVTSLFYIFPSFTFGKMFADISSVTCFRFDAENISWVKSERNFEWDDLFTH